MVRHRRRVFSKRVQLEATRTSRKYQNSLHETGNAVDAWMSKNGFDDFNWLENPEESVQLLVNYIQALHASYMHTLHEICPHDFEFFGITHGLTDSDRTLTQELVFMYTPSGLSSPRFPVQIGMAGAQAKHMRI